MNEAENKNSNTVIPSYWDNFPLTCQHTNGLELYDILFKYSLIKLTMLKSTEATPGIDLYILLAVTILNVNPSIVHFWKSTASFIYCNESIFQTKIVIVSSYVKAMWELEFGNGNTHNTTQHYSQHSHSQQFSRWLSWYTSLSTERFCCRYPIASNGIDKSMKWTLGNNLACSCNPALQCDV